MRSFSMLYALVAIVPALAHMEMTYPPPLRSKSNPFVPEPQYDYSMTSPLVASGTFPCKGYIGNSPMDSVANLPAGSPVSVTIGGSASHNGGSCQFALSYDQGKTWSTIYSYMGGCLTDGTTMSVTIPPEAPSGEALFAWDWFNHSGNREMYMNCAVVTVTGGGSGLSNPADFPPPFVAEAGVNQCETIEGIDVVFPSPGKNFKFGGSYAGTTPSAQGFTGSNCVPPGQTEAGQGPVGGGGDGAPPPSSSVMTSSSTASATFTSASSTVVIPTTSTPAVPGGGSNKPGTSYVYETTVITSTRSTAAPQRTGPNGKICRPKKKRSFGPAAPVATGPTVDPVSEIRGRVVVEENGVSFGQAEWDNMPKRHQRLVRRRAMH